MSQGRVTAIVGAQYGSEGKGAVVSAFAGAYDVHVRVGGPQAGHTLWHDGVRHVQRQLPCGWVNQNAELVIGRGALLDVELLCEEIYRCPDKDVRNRLWVDDHAWLVTDADRRIEGGRDGALNALIGSTGEGVGSARQRRTDRCLAHDNRLLSKGSDFGLQLTDTVSLLHFRRQQGANLLLEGTQGCGLSLVHGDWPYVTSHETNAATLAADCGVPPRALTDVVLVARTYPIRVAGNSGLLYRETTWEDVSKSAGIPVSEQTTVTQRTRRVGEWDTDLFKRACTLNEPTAVVFTFVDYLAPGVFKRDPDQWPRSVHEWLHDALEDLDDVHPHWTGDVWTATGPRPQDVKLYLRGEPVLR